MQNLQLFSLSIFIITKVMVCSNFQRVNYRCPDWQRLNWVKCKIYRKFVHWKSRNSLLYPRKTSPPQDFGIASGIFPLNKTKVDNKGIRVLSNAPWNLSILFIYEDEVSCFCLRWLCFSNNQLSYLSFNFLPQDILMMNWILKV